MSPLQIAHDPWATVLWHLDTAADLADDGDTLTELALASQIRLTRAAYPARHDPHQLPAPQERLSAPADTLAHLSAAAELLDTIEPTGSDAQCNWATLVHDLADTANRCLATAAAGGADWGSWR